MRASAAFPTRSSADLDFERSRCTTRPSAPLFDSHAMPRSCRTKSRLRTSTISAALGRRSDRRDPRGRRTVRLPQSLERHDGTQLEESRWRSHRSATASAGSQASTPARARGLRSTSPMTHVCRSRRSTRRARHRPASWRTAPSPTSWPKRPSVHRSPRSRRTAGFLLDPPASPQHFHHERADADLQNRPAKRSEAQSETWTPGTLSSQDDRRDAGRSDRVHDRRCRVHADREAV